MQHALPAPNRSSAGSRAALAAAALALHLLLLVGALQPGVWRDREPARAEPPPRVVWLNAGPAPAPSVRKPATPALPARRIPAAARATPTVAMTTVAITEAPALTPPAPPAPLADTDSPAPARPPPLNLSLPRRPPGASAPWQGARNPALDDPRSNSSKPTLDSRIAAALGGSDQITEYRLEDGSVRLKRGSSCVVVRPNRASALDPFNASAQIRPRLIDRC